MSKKLTTKIFISRSKEKHGKRYNYSKTKYKGRDKKLEIICETHGSFFQHAGSHMSGTGCPKCNNITKRKNRLQSTENVIKRFIEKHEDRYDYSKVNFKRMKSNVEIICKIHGSFYQTPEGHVRGQGCSKCAGNSLKTTYQFIQEANQTHDSFYKYPNTKYINSRTTVEILCPTHGFFWQRTEDHLNGHGCPKCSISSFKNDLPAILYYFKDTTTNLYKIGITNKKIYERFGSKMKEIELIETWSFDEGKEAYNSEQKILKKFNEFRTQNPNFKKIGGYTEFFTKDIIDEIRELL